MTAMADVSFKWALPSSVNCIVGSKDSSAASCGLILQLHGGLVCVVIAGLAALKH